MALRQRAASPVPYDELVAMQAELGPFDSTLWEGEARQILVGKVPGETLDLVNDLEGIVDRADPADVEKADACLLMASREIHQVPLEPLQQMMRTRMQFDAGQATQIRQDLDGLAHSFYRSAADPRRHLRLGVRLPNAQVEDVADETLEALVEQLGARLEKGYADVYCVYLVADQDFVRLDTQVFARDLLSKWQDDDRRLRLENARAREEAAERQRRESDRAELIHHLEGRMPVTYAPVKRMADTGVHAEVEPASLHQHDTSPRLSRSEDHDIGRRVDALAAPRSLAMTDVERSAPSGAPASAEPAPAQAHVPAPEVASAPIISTGDAVMDRLALRLQEGGYEVMARPDVPGLELSLAAERPDDYPQRLVACLRDRLRSDDAQALLDGARMLDVDLAIVVADAIDPQAQRLIVATKVKRIRPGDVDDLTL